MKARKHRLVIDITLSRAVTKRDAAKALRLLLDEIDKDQHPIWVSEPAIYCNKLTVAERSNIAP